MDEYQYECYTEWANDELIWGRGQFNWCRAYSLDDWKKKQQIKEDEEIYKIDIPF